MWLAGLLVLLGPGLGRAAAARVSSCAGQTRDGEAVLGALLPLHEGPNCSAVGLRGAQQEAALRAAVERANRDLRRDAISIGLRVLDTCSQAEEAVKAAMRALVAADQTCLHPPLFLGLVGPEDPDSLSAALKVTGVFSTVHVLPWGDAEAAQPGTGGGGGTLVVGRRDPEERAQALMLLVRRLRWPSFLLVHGADEASDDAANELLRLADADPEVCAQRRVLKLAADLRGDGDVAWTISKDDSGGVVVITERASRAAALLARLGGLPRAGSASGGGGGGVGVEGPVHVLVSVRAGGSSKQLTRLQGVAITLMHEVSAPPLVPGTQRALLTESPLWAALTSSDPDAADFLGLGPDSQDVSVGAMSVGVQLMGAALRAAHRIKCPAAPPPSAAASGEDRDRDSPAAAQNIFCPALFAMAADEWRSILQRVTAFADPGAFGRAASSSSGTAPSKLRFGMELQSVAKVFVKRSDSGVFEKAGVLVGGKDLQLDSSRFQFPAPRAGVDPDCGMAPAPGRPAPAPAEPGGPSAVPSAPPSKSTKGNKYNRGLDRQPRTTPYTPYGERPSGGGGGGLDVDWTWLFGGGDSAWNAKDYDFYQMMYVLAGAAGVMLLIFLCCFWMVYRNFRVKGERQDSDSNSSRKSRHSVASSRS